MLWITAHVNQRQNGYLDEDGCPDKGSYSNSYHINTNRDQAKILFETGSNVILEESYFILEEVGQALRDYPKLKSILKGIPILSDLPHTIKTFSKRAESVKDFLVERRNIII